MKSKVNEINYKRVLVHICFWIIIYLFNSFAYGVSTNALNWVFKATLLILPFEIFASYLTLYYFIPKYLFTKKYILFIVNSLITAVILVTLLRFVYIYILLPYAGEEFRITRFESALSENYFKALIWNSSYFNLYIEMYSIVGIASAIKLFKHWLLNQRIKKDLEKQNLKSEIALLQSQINPHFLFNTLNNIDYLVNNNRKKASDAIVKLSEILRYMLNDAKEKTVSLEKEISYLMSYIELQKLRHENNNFISFSLTGDVSGKLTSPMLFISFIENSFKHGSKKTKSPGIEINFTIDNFIKFECKNYISQEKINKDKTKGIGLANVKRRLELLYPEKHNLKIYQDSDMFIVELTLDD